MIAVHIFIQSYALTCVSRLTSMNPEATPARHACAHKHRRIKHRISDTAESPRPQQTWNHDYFMSCCVCSQLEIKVRVVRSGSYFKCKVINWFCGWEGVTQLIPVHHGSELFKLTVRKHTQLSCSLLCHSNFIDIIMLAEMKHTHTDHVLREFQSPPSVRGVFHYFLLGFSRCLKTHKNSGKVYLIVRGSMLHKQFPQVRSRIWCMVSLSSLSPLLSPHSVLLYADWLRSQRIELISQDSSGLTFNQQIVQSVCNPTGFSRNSVSCVRRATEG